MTATTQRRRQGEFASSPRRQRTLKKAQPAGSTIASSLKAGLVGGLGILLLMLISLVPFEFLACLVIPGFLVVWLTTGLLAGIFAGDNVQNSHQGGKVGWMAGFWAGVIGGIVAMAMAAFGVIMGDFGQNVVNQFPADQLAGLVNYGLTPEILAMAGRVSGALIVYGVIGSLVSGLFSSIGGMIYPKLGSQS
jgi:hypothetical protein